MDINKFAYCNSYWNDMCGDGGYGLSGQINSGGSNLASIELCNCMGVFVERSYWVKPVCAPYRIVNPSVPVYRIDVRLLYGEAFGSLNGTLVPGGLMTVGSGFSPFYAAEDACSDENNTVTATLGWVNGTSDGFAVVELLGEEYIDGGGTTNLQGSIVMCNNGNQGSYCGNTENTSDVNVDAFPSSDINVTDPMGVINQWCKYRTCGDNVIDNPIPLVPLPDFILNNQHEAEFTRDGALLSFDEVELAARQGAAARRRVTLIERWQSDLRGRGAVTIPLPRP
jgi:hypothetical protein